jgi:hypothetical protein
MLLDKYCNTFDTFDIYDLFEMKFILERMQK